MTDFRVLLIEDELVLAEIIRESLQSRGFTVVHTDLATKAASIYAEYQPDIVVLDVMLPDGDGFSVAKQIRNLDVDTPIIFLTSRSLPKDVVEGFESGGNDYLKKPFGLEELIVRMKALLNRNKPLLKNETLSKVLQLGSYQFEYPSGVLINNEYRRILTARECELLQMLIINKNNLVDRKTILMTFWGNDDYFSGRSLDVFIAKLRRYLKEDPTVGILNIRGQGYKLIY